MVARDSERPQAAGKQGRGLLMLSCLMLMSLFPVCVLAENVGMEGHIESGLELWLEALLQPR